MGKWVKVEGKSETFQTYLMIFQNFILKKTLFFWSLRQRIYMDFQNCTFFRLLPTVNI